MTIDMLTDALATAQDRIKAMQEQLDDQAAHDGELIAALTAGLDAERARADRAEAAIKRQAGAAKTLRKITLDEVQRLIDMDRSEYNAAKTLDSEREANAILTAQVEALAAERDAERARADRAEEELMAAQGQIADAQAAEARVAVLEGANAQLQSDLDLRNAQLEAVHEMAPATPGLLHARVKELREKKGPTNADWRTSSTKTEDGYNG